MNEQVIAAATRKLTQTAIDMRQQRDDAEQALSQAYYLVTGSSPAWSDTFGHEQALEDIGEAVAALKSALKTALAHPPLRAREETAELAKNLRKWAAVFREHPIPSDPKGEFLSVDLETAADLILSSTSGQEWRDISSAPKDGRELWLWQPGREKATVGVWIKESVTNNGQAVWMLYGGRVIEPTHWQPYDPPAPPVDEPIVADKETK